MAVVRFEKTWQANEFWDDVTGDPESRGRIYVGRWVYLGNGPWKAVYESDRQDVNLNSAVSIACDMMSYVAEVTVGGRPWSYAGVWVLSYEREYGAGVKFPRFWVLLCSIPNIPWGQLA